MSMVYIHRVGPVTTIDTWTLLSACGSVTAPGPVVVPGGKTRIKQILVSFGDETPSAAEGGYNWLVKLDGQGMAEGEQVFTPGSFTQSYTTAGPIGDSIGCLRFDVDMEVKAGGQVSIYAAFTSGVIVGVPAISVALGFA